MATIFVREKKMGAVFDCIKRAQYVCHPSDNQNLSKIFFTKAYLYFQLRQLKTSISYYRKAYSLLTKSCTVDFWFGYLLFIYSEQKEEGLSVMKKSIEHQPIKQNYYKLIEKLEFDNQLQPALFYCQQALKNKESSLWASLRLKHSNLLQKLGRYQETIQSYQTLIKQFPHFKYTYYRLAVALQMTGRIQQAFKMYTIAIEIIPICIGAHLGLAELLFKNVQKLSEKINKSIQKERNFEKIISLLSKAYSQKLQKLCKYFNSSSIYFACVQTESQIQKSKGQFIKSIVLSKFYQVMGRSLLKINKLEETIESYFETNHLLKQCENLLEKFFWRKFTGIRE